MYTVIFRVSDMFSHPEQQQPTGRMGEEVYCAWPVPAAGLAMAAFPCWPVSAAAHAAALRPASRWMPAVRPPRSLSFLEERDDKYDSRASRWHRTRLSWVRRSERPSAAARRRSVCNVEADEEAAGRELEGSTG